MFHKFHYTKKYDVASAESFFRTRTLEIRNESLPDLSKSCDFDTPGRSHMFFKKMFNFSGRFLKLKMVVIIDTVTLEIELIPISQEYDRLLFTDYMNNGTVIIEVQCDYVPLAS
ncbi:hypothetical protein LOTGIDRAFT_158845 [Lottia gigantea]|uniref:Uncharacterized protein n=1 Tax=Lottia gigantea TaxID=225164 RepID=V4CAQ1_LOTGI|nr:hypothetical protein LOTGIDRAFT_158845 [Lottia gigantea]ESO98889.1 hypothetical protein LOTGIDRAFT_158845 [Lottia gigantea]